MLIFFDVTIWGTVADWIMIVVTGLTAYFLWKTLQSQKDVQSDQTMLTKIEQERYAKEIRPSFTLLDMELKIRSHEGMPEIPMAMFEFKLNENPAKDVLIQIVYPFSKHGTWTIIDSLIDEDMILEADTFHIKRMSAGSSRTIFSKFTSLQPKSLLLTGMDFHITFKDANGNGYRQRSGFSRVLDNTSIHNDTPDRISE